MSSPSYRSRPDHLIALPQEQISHIDHWHPDLRLKEDRYESPVRKLFFFLFREGPVRTWRKYRARQRKKALGNKPVCIIVREKTSGLYYGGLQHNADQELYYFLPGACWEKEPARKDLAPIEKLDPFLGHVPKGWEGGNSAPSFQPLYLQGESKEPKKTLDLYAVGCGSYMLSEVLPLYLKKTDLCAAVDVDRSVLDLPELRNARQRSNDLSCALEADDAPERPKMAYIASYHSWHTAQALDFLEHFPKSRVIIEKPPCITERDLRNLWQVFDPERVFIAFHRRYAPMNRWIREWLHESGEPVMIDMRIHEAPIGPDHWYFAEGQGTRIAGNLCHWIDLALFWIPSEPVQASVAAGPNTDPDRSFYALHFRDGSMVHFTATDLGDPTYGVQEQVHVQGKEQEIILEDTLRVKRWHRGKWIGYRRIRRDKGHERMNADHLERILQGRSTPYPATDLLKVTRIQNSFIVLLRKGGGSEPLDLRPPEEKPDLSKHAEAGTGS